MAYLYTVPNITNGIDDALIGTVNAVSIFTPMFLAFVWFTILISGLISQQRRLGYADFPMWMVTASLGTLLVVMPLTLVSGLINQTTLVIVVSIIIITGAIFFFTRGRNDPI